MNDLAAHEGSALLVETCVDGAEFEESLPFITIEYRDRRVTIGMQRRLPPDEEGTESGWIDEQQNHRVCCAGMWSWTAKEVIDKIAGPQGGELARAGNDRPNVGSTPTASTNLSDEAGLIIPSDMEEEEWR